MSTSTRCILTRRLVALVILAAAWAAVRPAIAGGGGNVMPAQSHQRGYFLADLAEATAAFNVGSRNPADLPPIPFQVLFTPQGGNSNTFLVRPGTMFYVPLLSIDDSPPILGNFPVNLNDRAALEAYVFGPDQDRRRLTADCRRRASYKPGAAIRSRGHDASVAGRRRDALHCARRRPGAALARHSHGRHP